MIRVQLARSGFREVTVLQRLSWLVSGVGGAQLWKYTHILRIKRGATAGKIQ